MDERLERLEELKKQRDELYNQWVGIRQKTTDALFGELQNLTSQTLYHRADDLVHISRDRWGKNENYKWTIQEEIRFKEVDNPKAYDFHSTFTLYIHNTHIEINHGSSGTWGKKDVCQLARLELMKAIFDNEEKIIQEVGCFVNMKVHDDFDKLDDEISHINWEIEKEKRDAEEAAIKTLLQPGKFLAQKGYNWEYDEDGKAHKTPIYISIEKIEGLTKKSVLTVDPNYKWITHRKKLRNVISDIKNERLFVINSTDEKPEEVE